MPSQPHTHANLPLLFWSLEISVHYVWTFLSSDSPFFLFNLGHISLLTQALSLSFTLTLSLRFTSLHFVTSLSLSLSLSLLLPLSLNSLSATLAYHFVSCRSEEDQRRKLSFEIFGWLKNYFWKKRNASSELLLQQDSFAADDDDDDVVSRCRRLSEMLFQFFLLLFQN